MLQTGQEIEMPGAPLQSAEVDGQDAACWRLATEAGPLRVTGHGPGILRLTFGPPRPRHYGMLVDGLSPVAPRLEEGAAGRLTFVHGALCLTLETAPLRFGLAWRGATILTSITDRHFTGRLRHPPFARTGRGWWAALALASGEPVYGLGEQWASLDHRGRVVRSRVEDALGVNTDLTYKPVPFAWSPRGWGLFVHTTGDIVHSIGAGAVSHRSYALDVEDEALDLFLIAADDPAGFLERYTSLTGRSPAPPRWALGVWHSKAFHKNPAELLATARKLRERQIPGSVITLDGRAWLDTRTRFGFEFDPARFPNPKSMIDEVHDLGFKLCVWEYPLISVHNPLFADFERRGFLLKELSSGRAYRYRWDPAPFGEVLTPLPESGLVDFTHPGACAEWRDRHQALFDLGVDVIKSDFGEQVPDDCRAANGATGRELHNVYPLLYNRCVAEATARATGHGFVFARAAWAGSQRYPGHWGGDPQSDFEGLAASIRGGLSWSLSGGTCHASDIGGFYGPQPDPELYIRWLQAAVFAPLMRFHGVGAREPWVFGPAIEAIARRWLQLRERLIPYLERCLTAASESGLPPMRAMPLAFPDQPESWRFDTQYMLGPDLLVIPILEAGGRVRGHLPAGEWRPLEGGVATRGPRPLDVTFPLDRFPVFVRARAEGPAAG
jgi:alpha-D-xyloside xylohydrolase